MNQTTSVTEAEVAAFTFRWSDLPPLTRALPGTGGVIRRRLEDFIVDEVPLYLPEGGGSHAYAWVEKRGLTTRDLVVALTRAGVAERSIGVAGLKDKHAVTRQWLSVPNAQAGVLEVLEALEGVRILEKARHRNKLGVGHLLGNRFHGAGARCRTGRAGTGAGGAECAPKAGRTQLLRPPTFWALWDERGGRPQARSR